MGCDGSKPNANEIKIPSGKTIDSSKIQQTTMQNPESAKQLFKEQNLKDGTKQNLNYSDYQAFIQKSKQLKKTDYPLIFKIISINNLTDNELTAIKSSDICSINPLYCSRKQLVQLATEMIMENAFASKELNAKILRQLITEIAENYNSVSYHNFTHGFSLTHMLFRCCKMEGKIKQLYNDEQLTFYFIAGLTHDINHRGTNNLYQTKIQSNLAKIAENDAVLQKMHVRTFFEILRKRPELDVISKSKNPSLTKQKITKVILATDMGKHQKNMEKIPSLIKSQQQRMLLIQNLFHGCDISNALLPYQQFSNWGALLSYQFNEQTKSQALLNVPVTEFLKFKSCKSFYEGQIGFINTFVLPLWKQIGNALPQLQSLAKNAQINIQKLKQSKQKQYQ